MDREEDLRICEQFISCLRKGFSALDNNSQTEVRKFVLGCRHADGGFADRSGNPDLYYSFFGFCLCSALQIEYNTESNISFICRSSENETLKYVDKVSLEIIKNVFFNSGTGLSLFPLIKRLIKERKEINLNYRLFLLFLAYDYKNGSNAVLNLFMQLCFMFLNTSYNTPCSQVAAKLYVKKRLGMKTDKDMKILLSYCNGNEGFKMFGHLKRSDMLSMAAALFVLNYTGCDIRIIVPACLNFIQDNYDNGAFLSGDGDETRDLEYTFYGLLSIGSLIGDKDNYDGK